MNWRIEGAPDTSLPEADDAGMYDIEVERDGGQKARFSLNIPGDASADSASLMLILHYGGQPTRYYGRPLIEQLFAPALAPLNAYFVAPEAIDGPWHTETNESFVLSLVDDVCSRYAINPARVIVGGYSMGAMGTWHLLEHYPERFVAGVPVAGFPSQPLKSEAPVFAFHSSSDELFPLDRLETAVTEARERGVAIELTLAAVNGHYDVFGYRDVLSNAARPLAELLRA